MGWRATAVVGTLLFLAAGCSDETTSSAPASQPETVAELRAEDLAPFTDVTPLADGVLPVEASKPEAEKPAPPADAASVLRSSSKTPNSLETWALDAEASPQVRVASLRQLASVAPEQALLSAKALINDPETEPLLRSNAVAILARSEDPKADALIAGLEPKYQRLAQALRQRKER